MKKVLSLILALVLCLSLCACGSKNENITPGNNSNNTTTQNDNNTTQSDNNSPQSAYVGRWENKELLTAGDVGTNYSTTVVTLSSDGSGSYEMYTDTEGRIGGYDGTWSISEDGKTITLETPAGNVAFIIAQAEGKTVLKWGNSTFQKAE